MSSASNVLLNNQQPVQATPLVKIDNDSQKEHITNNFVQDTHDPKAIQIKDDKQKGRSKNSSKDAADKEEEEPFNHPTTLISYDNLRMLSDIDLDFSECDRLLNFIRSSIYDLEND